MSQLDSLRPQPSYGQPLVHYLTRLEQVFALSPEWRGELQPVADTFAFRATDYYLGLIDWNDPLDPIRQLIIPRTEELGGWGKLDPSNEAANTKGAGIQHKYPDTVVLLCTGVCAGLCRYCFRKRLFLHGNDETKLDISAAVDYISAHPEVTNVLLTGGDPLLLATSKLEALLAALRAIPHLKIIRIGTKIPAFNPYRVLDDQALQDAIGKYSTPQTRIYFMTHFDHPRELTEPAVECVDRLLRSGAICANQSPLIRGVNDDPAVLSDLYRRLSWIGCPPYYLFQMRPTLGNEPYSVPIVRGWEIFREALRYGSGLARRARFVMSHETGKIEILAVDGKRIYLRYQRAKNPSLRGRFLVYKRNDEARWLDDLEPDDDSDAPRFPPVSLLEVQEGPE
jgi:KamA family protein